MILRESLDEVAIMDVYICHVGFTFTHLSMARGKSGRKRDDEATTAMLSLPAG